MDAPTLTASMCIALTDLKLDELNVVYPGDRSYELGQTIESHYRHEDDDTDGNSEKKFHLQGRIARTRATRWFPLRLTNTCAAPHALFLHVFQGFETPHVDEFTESAKAASLNADTWPVSRSSRIKPSKSAKSAFARR